MKESLSAARNIHQILIIVCTVISIFSLSLRKEENIYSQALSVVEDIESSVDQLLKKPLNSELEVRGNHYYIDSARVAYFTDVKSNYSLSEILASLSTGPMSRNPKDSGPNLLRAYLNDDSSVPGLKVLRNSYGKQLRAIKKQSLANAKISLSRESEKFEQSARNDVDVSGLKVAADSIYIIGPFITLVLLIYLTSLVRHITRILEGNAKEVSEFPWIILFPDLPSQVITVFTLYFYPIISTWLIVFKSNISTESSWRCFIPFLIAFMTVSFLLISKVQAIHYNVYGNIRFKSLSDVLRGE